MARPAEQLTGEQRSDEPIRLLEDSTSESETELPSETDSGKKFIDHVADILAKQYRITSTNEKRIIRSRVAEVTDKLSGEFLRNDKGGIKLRKININNVRKEVRADIFHIFGSE